MLVLSDGVEQIGRQTVLFAESSGGFDAARTTVSGFDIVTGNKVWESPKLMGALRDISLVDGTDGPRWVIATSHGMHVTS